jgi:hypothetical protein
LVTSLGKSVFVDCDLLHTVSFSAGSQLKSIGDKAFLSCSSLKSIALPVSVEIIGAFSFAACSALRSVTFPPDSKLARIEESAFSKCGRLQSFFVPSQVEFIGEKCFYECLCVTQLTFVSPSHVRELLDLPLRLDDSVCQSIPDSVEVLSFCGCPRGGRGHDLDFGRESRLKQIRVRDDPIEFWSFSLLDRRMRCFLRVSSRSLRIFRQNLEFG